MLNQLAMMHSMSMIAGPEDIQGYHKDPNEYIANMEPAPSLLPEEAAAMIWRQWKLCCDLKAQVILLPGAY